MMPGEHPVEMLAECLARAFAAGMAEIGEALKGGDDALRYWLREPKEPTTPPSCSPSISSRSCSPSPMRTSAAASTACSPPRSTDADCPLFVISTVRSDFLDRFAEDLPRLVAVRNRLARPWTLAPIGDDGLREVIDGPARLAGLDVSEVREAMVAGSAGRAGGAAAGRERAPLAVGTSGRTTA